MKHNLSMELLINRKSGQYMAGGWLNTLQYRNEFEGYAREGAVIIGMDANGRIVVDRHSYGSYPNVHYYTEKYHYIRIYQTMQDHLEKYSAAPDNLKNQVLEVIVQQMLYVFKTRYGVNGLSDRLEKLLSENFFENNFCMDVTTLLSEYREFAVKTGVREDLMYDALCEYSENLGQVLEDRAEKEFNIEVCPEIFDIVNGHRANKPGYVWKKLQLQELWMPQMANK